MAECSTTLEYDIEEEMMERLTEKHEADAQRKEYERRLANGYPRNIPEERFLRLASYEDTGLEPEEITAMQHTLDEYHKVADPLLRAQADGRLVMLPCKVGDTVYKVITIQAQKPVLLETQVKTLGQAADVAQLIGKKNKVINIFLTREEAEAALKVRNGNQ